MSTGICLVVSRSQIEATVLKTLKIRELLCGGNRLYAFRRNLNKPSSSVLLFRRLLLAPNPDKIVKTKKQSIVNSR